MLDNETLKRSGVCLVFLIFFAWYISPLGLVGYWWFNTDGFRLHSPSVKSVGQSLGSNELGLEELPKFLCALLSAGGLGYLLSARKTEGKSATVFSIILLAVITLAATLSRRLLPIPWHPITD